MKILNIIVVFLLISCTISSSNPARFIDSTNGNYLSAESILNRKELFIYVMKNNECSKCASDILNYTSYDSKKELPELIVLTGSSDESILRGIEKNRNSNLVNYFKRTYYYMTSGNVPKEILNFEFSKINENEHPTLYHIKADNISIINDPLLEYISNNF